MQDEEAFRSGGARLGIKAHQEAVSLADKGTRPPAPASPKREASKSAAIETFNKVALHSTLYTLHPTPYTLHNTPQALEGAAAVQD